ncbi:MAG: carboxypeptidase-like regulatory domain-containing protein [Bacteroidia bacterium]
MKTHHITYVKPALFILLLISSMGLTFSPWAFTALKGDFLEEIVSKLRVFTAESDPERVYVHLDKSLYKPGESLWYTAYVRSATDMTPTRKSGVVHVELHNPAGGIDQKHSLILRDGMARGDFFIEEEKPGGIYKVKAYTAWQKNDTLTPLFEKEIQVQKVVLPRLKMKLNFPEKGYGPGQKVTAELSLETIENTPLGNYDVKWLVKLDNKKYLEKAAQTNAQGKLQLEFNLPKNLKSADGLLNVMLDYQGQAEAISRSMPITLNRVNLTFYPEGGDCITGLPSRIAFKAVDEHGKPVNAAGKIYDGDGNEVTGFSNYHHGMGAFELTPGKGTYYYARLSAPAGIDSQYVLPLPAYDGFTVQASLPENEVVHFSIFAHYPETISVVGQMRGKPLFATQMNIKAGENQLRVPVGNFPMGVAQFTFFDSYNDPMAERLVFVSDERKMKVEISTDKEKYMPREKVTMRIKTIDEHGKPVKAGLSLAVVDDKLFSYADDKSGTLLSRMLLEPEVKGKVEEPNFYFDHNEEKSVQARDYLLMTQGWRRFTWKEIRKLEMPEPKFAAERTEFSGQVQDYLTGRPLPNVKITATGSDRTWKSDRKGYFAVSGIPLYESPVALTFEYEGMKQEFRCSRYLQDMNVRFMVEKIPGVFASQDGKGRIIGRVLDAQSREPVMFANVVLEKDGVQLSGSATDLEGYFYFTTDATGTLNIRTSYVGYQPFRLVYTRHHPQQTQNVGEIKLNASAVELREVMVMEYVKPLIEIDATTVAETITKEEIKALPTRSVNQATAMATGVINPNVRGARAAATEYYVDGMKVRELAVPQSSIENLAVITGGLSAEFGNYESLNDQGITKDKRTARIDLDKTVRSDQRLLNINENRIASEDEARVLYYRAREFPEIRYQTTRVTGSRHDFRSTIYWNGEIITSKDGEAEVEFYNSDAVTSFRAVAEGFANNGLVGRAEKTYFSQMPFSLSLKVPPTVLVGDELRIPVTLANNTDEALAGNFSLTLPKSWSVTKPLQKVQTIPAGSAKTLWMDIRVLNHTGTENLEVAFDHPAFADSYRERVTTMSRGFPRTLSYSAQVMEKFLELDINDPMEETMLMEVAAYPSIADQLLQGVESMLREPHGCFEQTSSSVYPNILVLDYLRESGTLQPDVEKKALALLDKGYKRLITFETQKKGYDWFGKAPGHQALTAYGLMEFNDMAQVYGGVSEAMVSRTAGWLMNERDGKGGFARNSRQLDGFGGADNDITNAYIVNALTQAGYRNISREIESVAKAAFKSKDPYQLALVAPVLRKTGSSEDADNMLAQLVMQQQPDGSWIGASRSITNSSGRNLALETTALALLAILEQPKNRHQEIRSAVNFIMENRSGYGGFGSTQATILCLKALTSYTRFAKRTKEPGTLTVMVNGKKAGQTSWEADREGVINVQDLAPFFKSGKNRIIIKFKGMNEPIPFSLLAKWNEPLPPSDSACRLALDVKLSAKVAEHGETVRLTSTIANKTSEPLASPIAIIGIPAGLSPQPWQLRELQEKEAFDYYEIWDNNIVFYFRGLNPHEIKTIHLDLRSEIKGRFEGEAASAYLYYDNDAKSWASAGAITVR